MAWDFGTSHACMDACVHNSMKPCVYVYISTSHAKAEYSENVRCKGETGPIYYRLSGSEGIKRKGAWAHVYHRPTGNIIVHGTCEPLTSKDRETLVVLAML